MPHVNRMQNACKMHAKCMQNACNMLQGRLSGFSTYMVFTVWHKTWLPVLPGDIWARQLRGQGQGERLNVSRDLWWTLIHQSSLDTAYLYRPIITHTRLLSIGFAKNKSNVAHKNITWYGHVLDDS